MRKLKEKVFMRTIVLVFVTQVTTSKVLKEDYLTNGNRGELLSGEKLEVLSGGKEKILGLLSSLDETVSGVQRKMEELGTQLKEFSATADEIKAKFNSMEGKEVGSEEEAVGWQGEDKSGAEPLEVLDAGKRSNNMSSLSDCECKTTEPVNDDSHFTTPVFSNVPTPLTVNGGTIYAGKTWGIMHYDEALIKLGNPDEKWIKHFISPVKVTLFSSWDYGGFRRHDLDLTEPGFDGEYDDLRYGCRNVQLSPIASVKTYGKCLRIFLYPNCKHWSLAIYPGSGNSRHVTSKTVMVNTVGSIGPCLPEEFRTAVFKDVSRTRVSKKITNDIRNDFPDLLAFSNPDKIGWIPLGRKSNFLSYAGPNNRLETVFDCIEKIPDSSTPRFYIENSTHYKSLKKELEDVVGYAIALEIGGPEETNNFFPQTPASKAKWSKITEEIARFVEVEGNKVDVYVNFMYEDKLTSRPFAFGYHFTFLEGSGKKRIVYGRVIN